MSRYQDAPRMEFHISRTARDRYRFDKSLFALSGNMIFANFHAARIFAQAMNNRRDLLRYPEAAVKAGQINAMGLIDEILHFMVKLFQESRSGGAVARALSFLEERVGKQELDRTLLQFTDQFPPLSVYRDRSNPSAWLEGKSGEVSHREMALEELLLLWLANQNPAFSPYLELFDDSLLERATAYRPLLEALAEFFESEPRFGPEEQDLIAMLSSPAVAHPHSLTDQLDYIRRRWGHLIGQYLYRLLGSLDLIREEQKLAFLGAGPALVADFRALELDLEAFSPDRDWMPRVVMIAKNAFVWLDQLSRRSGRELRRLDQVPDEELDRLARWGFTALWLIGLWERSAASKRIKQLCGNPEAEASAYSLTSYDISPDLGGWEAFHDLKNRAWQRGIRMAGDMVPNHMGIDSRWVMEHPDWFVSLPYSPFPSYTFSGPDLSWDPGTGIFLEDHYYSRSDAAVAFRRLDRGSGEERYIYHGNDGTSMPWNDTAQLDFLKPEVREAVIQTILHVARFFPIIRFDAAMTLTRKHFQRLWFPEPGSGGDIPSRADHGLSRERFEQLMPGEFWREVVDRVAREMPDTLLLAEAFWLLEGYFVRSLGMHRVYNSAFMNMLKNEDNAQYRQVIKNTLEFNPEILKRFVNFMNNPDEETAVAQFGKGDKYFGVCILIATLPGLPMFGHGQIEGFTEKYGMEYRKAYREEQPDQELIRRHEREIAPLLHQRTLFAEAADFLLYDFRDAADPEGPVNEDVFAYSNCSVNKRSLVIYHNRFAETRGWIRLSAAVAVPSGQAEERTLVRRSLGEGLGLSDREERYTIFRDRLSDLEYLRGSGLLHREGLYVELKAYKAHVFLDFREVTNTVEQPYAALADYLNGRGVPSIESALRQILLQPVHLPFRELANGEAWRGLIASRRLDRQRPQAAVLPQDMSGRIDRLCAGVRDFASAPAEAATLASEMKARLGACLDLPSLTAVLPLSGKDSSLARALRRILGDEQPGSRAAKSLAGGRSSRAAAPLGGATPLGSAVLRSREFAWGTLLGWLLVHALGKIMGSKEGGFFASAMRSRSWIDEWLLGRLLASALEELGLNGEESWRSLALVKILTSHQCWFEPREGEKLQARGVLETLLADSEVQEYLRTNRHQDVLWFHAESFDELLAGLLLTAAVDALRDPQVGPDLRLKRLRRRWRILKHIDQAKARSGYQVERLLEEARQIS